jgi:hypothetical protein
MADPGVSGQNFLRILFGGTTGRGGLQGGLDTFERRQPQEANLLLQLQQMQQQQGQFQAAQAQQRDLSTSARRQRAKFHEDEMERFARLDATETARFERARVDAGTEKTKQDQADLDAISQLNRLAEENPGLSDMFDTLARTPNPREGLRTALTILGNRNVAQAAGEKRQAPPTARDVDKLASTLSSKLLSEALDLGIPPGDVPQYARRMAEEILGVGGGMSALFLGRGGFDIDTAIEETKAQIARMKGATTPQR